VTVSFRGGGKTDRASNSKRSLMPHRKAPYEKVLPHWEGKQGSLPRGKRDALLGRGERAPPIKGGENRFSNSIRKEGKRHKRKKESMAQCEEKGKEGLQIHKRKKLAHGGRSSVEKEAGGMSPLP